MILVLLAIFDAAASAYMRPFVAQSRGEAIRAFQDLVADVNHPVGQHPEDYTLFVVGSFDVTTGSVKAITPESLGNALEFRARARVMKLEGTNDA